jgi:hypothetical protein
MTAAIRPPTVICAQFTSVTRTTAAAGHDRHEAARGQPSAAGDVQEDGKSRGEPGQSAGRRHENRVHP